MRSKRLLWIIPGAVIAVAAAGWLGTDWWLRYRYDRAAAEIAALVPMPAGADFRARTDAVRTFINDHSKHAIDAEFYADWPQPRIMAEKLVAFARGLRATPPHMECSTRAALMSAVLRTMGYQTRQVHIYSAATLQSHSFLETMNPDTGAWEVQDPDYDITWRTTSSSERISITKAAARLEHIEPCGRTACGWDTVSREGTKAAALRDYLDFIVVRSRESGGHYTVYTPRADPRRIYERKSRKGTFCELHAKYCRDGLFAIGAGPDSPQSVGNKLSN